MIAYLIETIAPIQEDPLSGIQLVDGILLSNRNFSTLTLERERAQKGNTTYILRDGLLLFNGRLVVLDDGDLYTQLCNEFHRLSSQAYLGRNKMRKMVAERYF